MSWIVYVRVVFQVASLGSMAKVLALKISNTGKQITEES